MKGRRFAAVLLVLSMLLMLVPMQAFAEDEVVPETASVSTVSEAAVTAESTVPEESVTAESAVQAVSESEVVVPEAQTEAAAEEIAAEETAEPETEAKEAAEAVESTSAEEAVVAASSEEETVQTEAALAGESGELTQMAFSETTSGVTWGNASSTVDANGVRTVMFTATIPEGTTASELNLNVLNSGNLSALSNTDTLIQYVVNVTDNTNSYQFKADSGAVALVDGTGAVAGTGDASAVLLGASASGSFAGADTYLTVSGEGNGFNAILQSQWGAVGSSHVLSYYQQTQAGNQPSLYPVVQFKLTKADTAAVSSSSTAEQTDDLSGSVPLTVKKVLTGQTLQADQFTFELKDENGNVLQTKKNAQDGTIPFDALNFTQNDLGEHKYTINEVMPEGAKADNNGKIVVDNIEYDTHTESVTITISLNEEGKLKATVRQSTTELTFTNKYVGTAGSTTSSTTSRTSPATGDSTPIMPYISMLTGAFLALVLSKRLIRAYAKR